MVDRDKDRLSDKQAEIILDMIDPLPFPIAIFDRNLTLILVNKAFRKAAYINNSLSETVSIRRDRIDDPQLAASFMRVFKGDTVFSESVKSPFSMFSGIEQKEVLLPGCTYRVEVSPFPAENTKITHGVIVIIHKKQDNSA
jgi:hypothetical protein